MNRTRPVAQTEDQTAVSACILMIIFNDIAFANYTTNIRSRYHPIRTRHLPNGMGQEKNAFRCRDPYQPKNVRSIIHLLLRGFRSSPSEETAH